MVFMWYFSNSNKYNPNASQYSSNLLPEVTFQNSLPVGSIVNLPKLTSISGRIVPNTGKRVFLFVSRTCGSCEYISLAIPELAKTFSKLTWVYVEKSSEPPIIGTSKLENLYIVKNGDTNLSSLFESKYTPTFFFIDNDNKIVWKRRGFIPPDYYTLKDILAAFNSNNYELLNKTYQRNLAIGKKFPSIIAYTYPDDKKIVIPNNFIGKSVLIFILHYSCSTCSDVINALPQNLKNSNDVIKIIVFSPFSEKLNQEALRFAKEFGFTTIEKSVESPLIKTTWNDIYRHDHGMIYINDSQFYFQNLIGIVGSPYVILLNKNGHIEHIYSPNFYSKDQLKNFYASLYKLIKNERR